MPTYEFRCRACGTPIEQSMHVDEYDRAKQGALHCPRCGSNDVAPQIAHFEVKTSRKAF